jgi:hypothetical protein
LGGASTVCSAEETARNKNEIEGLPVI